jgi:MoaA/NifB/PqqE/SkfB family radical SAM enzyme
MGVVYTRYKVLHFQDKVKSLPQHVAEIRPPIHIRVKPTNICNHSCRYCAYHHSEQLQLGKDMVVRDIIPREKMMELIDDFAEMGVKAVTFSGGGEPFVYPHLLEAVEKLASTKLRFASLTNGARLKGRIAELFAHRGSWIRISIDGWDDASYSRYRGIRHGEFTKVMANMEAFKKLGGKCYLGVSLIVDRENGPHVYEFTRKMKSVGVDSVKMSPVVVNNDGVENNKYHQPTAAIALEQIQRAIADLTEPGFEIFNAYHALEEKFSKSYTWCPYLQVLPVIGADQNVYSCQDKAYNLEEGRLGSLKDQRFIDFWFSDKNQFFKIDPSKHCNHHCVANEKNKLILDFLGSDAEHLEFV